MCLDEATKVILGLIEILNSYNPARNRKHRQKYSEVHRKRDFIGHRCTDSGAKRKSGQMKFGSGTEIMLPFIAALRVLPLPVYGAVWLRLSGHMTQLHFR